MINLISKYEDTHKLKFKNIYLKNKVFLDFNLINKYPNEYFLVTDSKILFEKCLINLLNINDFIYRIKLDENDCYYFLKSPINNQKIVDIDNIFHCELLEKKLIVKNIFGLNVKKRFYIPKLQNSIYIKDKLFNNQINWEVMFPQVNNEIYVDKCEIISLHGLITSCDIYKLNFNTNIVNGYDFSTLIPGSTIYICGSAIPHFIQVIAPQIKCKYILVSGDCAEIVLNEDFEKFANSPNLIHWFSQNCMLTSHPKLSQIPIGIDYHTMAEQDHEWGNKTTPLDQEKLLKTIASKAKPLEQRIPLAYANFQFLITTKFGSDRVDAINQVPKDLIYYEPTKIKRLNTWVAQSKYAFVISPHGNGLDCHRTWEALALGCIPIVKTSPLDPLFEELPVLIVKQLSDVTQDMLNQTIQEYSSKQFNLEKLKLSYWIGKIESVKNI